MVFPSSCEKHCDDNAHVDVDEILARAVKISRLPNRDYVVLRGRGHGPSPLPSLAFHSWPSLCPRPQPRQNARPCCPLTRCQMSSRGRDNWRADFFLLFGTEGLRCHALCLPNTNNPLLSTFSLQDCNYLDRLCHLWTLIPCLLTLV